MAAAGVTNPLRLSYVKISEKLTGPRVWVGTRYYIGALKQNWNPQDYANQRTFLSQIQQEDKRITVHLGRLERRIIKNPLKPHLNALLSDPRLDKELGITLRKLIGTYGSVETLQEKAVDVQLAIDMVEMALAGDLDSAYLLSADGDLTPPVASLKARGKKVYVASPGFSSQLEQVADAFIHIKRDWFADCYR